MIFQKNIATLEEYCHVMDEFAKCIVKELGTCKDSTSANYVEALLRSVRKVTPCGKFAKTNSGEKTLLSAIVLFGAWLVVILN